VVRNRNGSFDMGPMQINSLWLPTLRTMGLTAKRITDDGCTNVAVGTAILSVQLKAAHGNINKAVGWYHSHTHWRAQSYRNRVAGKLRQLLAPGKAK